MQGFTTMEELKSAAKGTQDGGTQKKTKYKPGEKEEMEERVQSMVEGIYVREKEKYRKLRKTKSEDIDEEKVKEVEEKKEVRETAINYMEKGFNYWTPEVRTLHRHVLRCIEGRDDSDEIVFDNKATINTEGVMVHTELHRAGLK